MRDYIKLEKANENTINNYLDDGWEIIETTKSAYPEGDTLINYHVGLPAMTMMKKYKSIIDDYEKFGLKETLFQKVAESYNTDLENYMVDDFLLAEEDEVAKYFTEYEKDVHGESIYYSIKGTSKAENKSDDDWF